MENEFLSKLNAIIEEHISDPDFNVDKLAGKMSMSYSSLWRRVSKYTGKTANQYIREIRLTKAMEMLREEDISISEAAYRTGFSSPNYFSTCFQDLFGYPPGELKKLEWRAEAESELSDKQVVTDSGLKPGLNGLQGLKISGKKTWITIAISIFLVVIVFTGFKIFGDNRISIAVLYPDNLDKDSLSESFCGGIQEQLYNDLFRLEIFAVRSRVSSEQFRSKKTKMNKIGRKLRADYIIMSNVNKTGAYSTFRANLINTKKDNTVWAKTYERIIEDQFAIQDEISLDVVRHVKNELIHEEVNNSVTPKTVLPLAESYFRQGKHYSGHAYFDLSKACENFLKAVEIDSLYAEAYIGLSSILTNLYSDIETRHDTLMEFCFKALAKAEMSDGRIAGLHNQRGLAYLLQGKHNAAIEEFKTELKLNPDFNEELINISKAFASMGKWIDAENALLELFHRDQYTDHMSRHEMGYFYELKRDLIKAKDHYEWAGSKLPSYEPTIYNRIEISLKSGNNTQEAKELLDDLINKSYIYANDSLRLNYEYAILDIYQGRYEDAINRFSGWKRVTPQAPPYYFRPKYLVQAQACEYLNKHQDKIQYYDSARVFIENLQQGSESIRNEPAVESALGVVYAGLGMKEKALACSEKTIQLLIEKPDALMGPYAMEDVALIYAKTGNFIKAVEILKELLSQPGPLMPKLLELDPKWEPLHDLPEFHELINP